MSPMPGIFCIVDCIWLFSRPAIANVCPLRSSISVSVRRVDRAGMRKPFNTTALPKSSVLTSGLTLRLTRSPLTVGVKFRRTPNSLNLTETARLAPEPCATGTGNSPPARKLASLPLCGNQVRLGKALEQPRCCIARISAPRSYFWLKKNRFRKSPKLILPEALVTGAPKSLLSFVQASSVYVGPGTCGVAIRPMVFSIPVGLVKKVAAELADRAAADFGEAHAQHHLLRRRPRLRRQQRDHVVLLVDVASSHRDRLLGDFFARHVAGQHDRLTVAVRLDVLAREELLELLVERRRGRARPRSRSASRCRRGSTRTSRSRRAPCRAPAADSAT